MWLLHSNQSAVRALPRSLSSCLEALASQRHSLRHSELWFPRRTLLHPLASRYWSKRHGLSIHRCKLLAQQRIKRSLRQLRPVAGKQHPVNLQARLISNKKTHQARPQPQRTRSLSCHARLATYSALLPSSTKSSSKVSDWTFCTSMATACSKSQPRVFNQPTRYKLIWSSRSCYCSSTHQRVERHLSCRQAQS